MLYRWIRPLLFTLDPEAAHHLSLAGLTQLHKLGLVRPRAADANEACEVMGLKFPNRVGLAAGLDKNGDYLDALAALGFGFIEIGTVTPRAQPGNPRPRLFRLTAAEAVINRMGFNNNGVDYLTGNVERARYRGILGINIGKNFDTPIEHAEGDYLHCLRKVYAYASYVTLNISSPNTENLRELQQGAELDALLTSLRTEQVALAAQHHKRVPLAIKIAPDLEAGQIETIAGLLLKHEIDAVIATNTTVSRAGVAGLDHAEETGGLSGAPVREKSTAIVRELAERLGTRIPIIGVGGIMSGNDALERIRAGASLVQVYTGLVYRGPALVDELRLALQPAAQPTQPTR